MSFPALFLRAKRKYRSDGIQPLLSEAISEVLESGVSRAVVRKKLLQTGTVIERPELRAKATRQWQCDPQDVFNPFEDEVQLPEKTRLNMSGSFNNLETRLPTDPFVTELQDVTITSPVGLAITKDGRLIKETIAPGRSSNSRLEKCLARHIRHNGYRYTKKAINQSLTDADQTHSHATVLVPLWKNYYHWTLECLPKILGVETYREKAGHDPTILIPPNPSPWMRESLELLGLDKTKIVPLQPGATRVSHLIVPSYPTPSRKECHWLRKRVHDSIDVEKTDANECPNRIYVTRRNATVRRVKNEPELLDVLSGYDIEPYALETLSVSQQARLFATADLVVSPHGAGLANLVYGTSPTVLEVFGDKEKTTFYRLAKLMGFEYDALFCDHDRKDIIVDLEALESAISEIIDGTNDPILEERRPEDNAHNS